jgi:15-cis-phytoene synthase/lycopene beta-cyclase
VPSATNPSEDALLQARLDTLASIRKHLRAAYETKNPARSELDSILDTIPNLTPSCRSAFHLFSTIVPRLVPIEPFLELCQGYESDLQFYDPTTTPLETKMKDEKFALEDHLPIKTTKDLMEYADNVAGSIAAAICYLAWSVLDTPEDIDRAKRPIEDLAWSKTIHSGSPPKSTYSPEIQNRIYVVEKAREMGRALQLVNIARDVAKDAVIARVYVPLSSFSKPSDLLSILQPTPTPSYSTQTLPLLDMADDLRVSSRDAIGGLPPTARGGMRAMVASYFEIGEAIRKRGGEVEDKGIRVSKKKRAWAASRAMWGFK